MTSTHPIEGQVVLLAGARASVTLTQLSGLLERVQGHLADQRETYERTYERIEGRETVYYLADAGHWDAVGAELGFDDRETDAVRRAHADQFTRDGRRLDREAEFESALSVRDPVAIA